MAPTFTTMGWSQNTTTTTTSSALSLRDELPTIPTVQKGGNWVIYGIIIAIAGVIAALLLGWVIRRQCFDKKSIKKYAEQAQREDTARAFDLADYPPDSQRQCTWANMGDRIEAVLQADKRAWVEMGVNPYEETPRDARRATFDVDVPRQTILPPPGVIDPPRVRTPGVPTAAALAARSRLPVQRKPVSSENSQAGPSKPNQSKTPQACMSADVATFRQAESRKDPYQWKPVPLNNSLPGPSQPRESEIPQASMSADVATFRQAERRQKVYDNMKSKAPAKDAKPHR